MRILLIYDADGWFHCHQAHDLQRYGPPQVHVTALPLSRIPLDVTRCFDAVLNFSWSSWRKFVGVRSGVIVAEHGCRFGYNGTSWAAKFATSRLRSAENAARVLPQVDFILAANRQLEAHVKKYNSESVYCPLGLNTDAFFVQQEIPDRRDKLRVGWCGPPTPNPDVHGRAWVLDEVQRRCGKICEFQLLDRTPNNAYDRNRMANWYNDIDLLLCTSMLAGTPATCLEAMACGRPVLGPHVGDLADLVVDGWSGCLVEGYSNPTQARETAKQLSQHLLLLAEDRPRVQSMGKQAAYDMHAHRDWRKIAPQWFDHIMGI